MISVMYSGNDRMFDGILISALSTIKHTKESINVYLLTMDLSDINSNYKPINESQRLYIESIYKSANSDSKVTIIDVGDMYRERFMNSPNAFTEYTPYTFLRLFIDKVQGLPNKILYLDTDIVVNGDLSELYNTCLDGYEYAAALDYYGKVFLGRNYINAGVLLLNLSEIRKTGLFERAIDLCQSKKLFLPDQTAIYKLTKRNYILNRKYNEQKRYNRKDTVIQHFTKTILWLPYFHTRNIKPWETEKVRNILTNRYDEILENYLIKKQEFVESYDK